MKIAALVLCLFAVAAADDFAEIDWSNVRPVREMPGFYDNKPAILNVNAKTNLLRDRRIVGGQEAERHQFPYQAALLMNRAIGTGLCGGSLVTIRTVLTAAHCIDFTDLNNVLVILGAHNIRVIEPNQQRRTVQARTNGIYYHETWTPSLIQNDIGVVRFDSAVTINTFVQTVRQPALNDNRQFEGAPVTVSGWGRYSDSSPASSDVLKFYFGTVLTQAACRVRFPGVIQDNMICLAGTENGGACQGDSGGPLTFHEGGSLQVGIVSFGLALGCELSWPSVFVRTSSFTQWIANESW